MCTQPLGRLQGLKKEKTVNKFSESCWKFAYYFPLLIYTIVLVSDEPFSFHLPFLWIDDRYFWTEYPFVHATAGAQFVLLLQMAFYIHSQFYLMFLEGDTGQARSDFVMMSVHHCTTVALIIFSYCNEFWRLAVMILIVHDVSDIFLETAKISKYMRWQRLCDVLFIGFAVSWVVFRLYLFPVYMVWSCLTSMPQYCPLVNEVQIERVTFLDTLKFYATTGDGTSCVNVYPFKVLLFVLLILHCVWFYLIALMTKRAIFDKQVVKDIRSDDEASDDESSKKKK